MSKKVIIASAIAGVVMFGIIVALVTYIIVSKGKDSPDTTTTTTEITTTEIETTTTMTESTTSSDVVDTTTVSTTTTSDTVATTTTTSTTQTTTTTKQTTTTTKTTAATTTKSNAELELKANKIDDLLRNISMVLDNFSDLNTDVTYVVDVDRDGVKDVIIDSVAFGYDFVALCSNYKRDGMYGYPLYVSAMDAMFDGTEPGRSMSIIDAITILDQDLTKVKAKIGK